MSDTNVKLTWDAPEDRKFEYGVSQGVFYGMDANGAYTDAEAWNGLTKVSDNPSGAESNKLWADGIEYADLPSKEQYSASIEAFMYPPKFAVCDGSAQPMPGMFVGQQTRKKFGLSWRTEIGNANNSELGYKIHVAYGLRVTPSEQSHDTVNENPDASSFSWDASGTPVPVTGYKPTCKLTFDSTVLGPAKMAVLEDMLYGRNAVAAVAAVYSATEDTAKQAGKTYYTRTGTEGNYSYTAFDGESFVEGTTYYELTTPASAAVAAIAPSLPMPDVIRAALEAVA